MLPLQRLLARLPSSHPRYQAISKKVHQLKAGYEGELYVDKVLNEIAFPHGTSILKDITLEINPDCIIQIDTLIITPYTAFLLEVKNYSGFIQFNHALGKTIKTSPKGEVDKYDCIIHQLDRAKTGLLEWLSQQNIDMPLKSLIVMANSKTDLSDPPETATLKYAKQIPFFIRSHFEGDKILSGDSISEITKAIQRGRKKWWSDLPCNHYQIAPNDLKRGVLCMTCNEPTTRLPGHSWFCYTCKTNSKSALKKSVDDWFILVSPTVTNKQIRIFLNLKSSSAASVVLRSQNLKRHGATRNIMYTKK